MRFPRRRGAFASALALTLIVPAAAAAAPADLSPTLAKISTPSLRDESATAQADAAGIPAGGPGSVARAGGRPVVEIRFDHGAREAVDELRAAGAHILDVSLHYQVVTADVDEADLRAVARVPGV